MAGVALTLVVLGHEGEGDILLSSDLLGSGLVDRVTVARGQRLVVLEGDFVLAQVALPLGALHLQSGTGHGQPDAAQQRLDPGATEDGVVDVVEVCWREIAIARLPRLLVTVEEDDELQLGADECRHAGIGKAIDLAPKHLAW